MIVMMIKNLENKMKKMQELINKDLEELKNKQTETNNTITEIKNTLEKPIAEYLKQKNESVSWKIKMVEITSEEQNKVKRMKTTEDSHRDLWDNYRGARRRGEKKGYEKIFEEIIVENFPNMEKEIVNQVQEAQRVPYRINPRRNMPRQI